MVENTEQEYHGNRSDAAEGDQTETVARTVLVTSRGGETNTDGHNKGTVIGPVVTPPESNATAMKSAGAAKESKNSAA